jgi:ribosomal protein S21
MNIEVKKGERENSQSLIRRFTRSLRNSGILIEAKKTQFYKKEKSKPMQQRAALRKLEKREEYTKQKKLGKI